MKPSQTNISGRSDACLAAVVLLAGSVIAAYYLRALWTFDEKGFSILSGGLPYWDFSNLWAGARMALDGHVAYLFDVDAYRMTLRTLFSPDLPNQEWSYPPSILLLGAPLAALPIFPAYLVWTFGTVFCLWLAIRPLRLGRIAGLAVVLSPAVVMNAIFGQNGALTTALLIGGLVAAPGRPVLAGMMFGLLTIKPHLGILVPFCLLASGNWRAILAASATTFAIAAITALFFGFAVWPQFFAETRTLMTGIMEAPYPQPYHSNAITVFFTARAAGFGLAAAYGLQTVMSVAAIAAVTWLWLPGRETEHRERVVLTAVLAILATPYGYTYDTISVAVVVAFLFMATARPPRAILGIFWVYAFFAHILNNAGFSFGVLVPLSLAAWMLASIWARGRIRQLPREPSIAHRKPHTAS
ncbi:glycosyltransferase family 87 protein [Mesorhizobium sp.]|uniref:glycosyltransferase family 87 protein n=1 Tax=Mesorhizobium sp. TaxID=1871066 RepID=UPI001228CB49|nr:glycosyltransferase family 87 protein [Mesorhizobium sp.]TIS60155.1 MAG: DUF2029 domain-containing protein [Mesorhizobium sp.]TIS89444.1 MAG: DUF2029 domain-containing protein [Mesorhizobium sp.]